jgi:signal transduction histidine kinase
MRSNYRPHVLITVLTATLTIAASLSLTGCVSAPGIALAVSQPTQALANLPTVFQIAGIVIVALVALQLLTLAYNALVRWQIARHTRGLRVLTEAMSWASKSFALEAALGEPLALLLRHLRLPTGAIHLLDPDQGRLKLICLQGLADSARADLSDLSLDGTIMGQAAQTGLPVRLAGAADQSYLRALSGDRARICAISVPITSGRRNIGALTLATGRYRALTEDESNLMAGLGHHLGVVVENLHMVEAMRAQAARSDTALADLRASESTHDELKRDVSRELRTPLTQVRDYVGILLDGELNDSAKEGLSLVLDRVEHMIELLNTFGASGSPVPSVSLTPPFAAAPRSNVPGIASSPAAQPHSEPEMAATPDAPARTSPAFTQAHDEPTASDAPPAEGEPSDPGWRMSPPVELPTKRKSRLSERLARLDRLQRIALGAGIGLLVLFVALLVVFSIWQQAHW